MVHKIHESFLSNFGELHTILFQFLQTTLFLFNLSCLVYLHGMPERKQPQMSFLHIKYKYIEIIRVINNRQKFPLRELFYICQSFCYLITCNCVCVCVRAFYKLHSVSVYHSHSQKFDWPGAITENFCLRYDAVGTKPGTMWSGGEPLNQTATPAV